MRTFNLIDCHLKKGTEVAGELEKILSPVAVGFYPGCVEQGEGLVRHYHACDEYWVILKGVAYVEIEEPEGNRTHFYVSSGDVVATPRGFSHFMFGQGEDPVEYLLMHGTEGKEIECEG